MADIYFSGQGKVYVAARDGSGNAGVFRDLGNVPALKVSLNTDVLEHKESRTGGHLTDLRLIKEKTAKVTITLEAINVKNLEMLLYGTTHPITASTVTNELSPTGLVAGDIVQLSHTFLNSGTPAVVTNVGAGTAWVVGTNYSIDYDTGLITVINTAVGTAFEVDYAYKAEDTIGMFQGTQVERWVRFAGLNTADSNKRVNVELFRVVFDPVSNFDLINNELAQFELEGSVLYDSVHDTSGSVLGGFGRISKEI